MIVHLVRLSDQVSAAARQDSNMESYVACGLAIVLVLGIIFGFVGWMSRRSDR